jgi:predicted ATP-dependent endonuclease of OLD family
MTKEITDVAGEIIDLQVLLRLGTPDIKKVITNAARIHLSDGTETHVKYQGHGAQRTFIYALIRYIANKRAQNGCRTRPVILLFEEPEIYMHPQLLRTLKDSLKELSSTTGWQVVVTTHSPIMIDVADDPKSLVILRKMNNETGVMIRQLESDPFVGQGGDIDERQILRAALDFHPTVCEAFFAEHAVLVEGDSEIAIFRFGKELVRLITGQDHKIDCYTFVSCGGKWTILPIARLLKLFGIPLKIIHDKDAKGRSATELSALPGFHPYNANSRIAELVGNGNVFVVNDKLEDILFSSGIEYDEDDKPYSAWKRIKQLIDTNTVAGANEVVNMVCFAYGIQRTQ